MKLALIFVIALPVSSAFALVKPGANAIPAQSTQTRETSSDSTRALNQAAKDGASTSKIGGGTLLTDDASSGSTVQPTTEGVPADQAQRTAKQELKTGPTSIPQNDQQNDPSETRRK